MLHVYHPSKSNTGFACSFSYSDKDNCVFATIIKQAGWDEKSGTGSFKASLEDPTKRVNIKLSELEVAAILDCIERNRPFSSFHDHDEKPKQIQFVPWLSKPQGDDDKPQQRGYSFSITATDKKTDNVKISFFIGLNFAEARTIREFLIFCLHRRFETLINRTKQPAFKKEIEPSAPSPQDIF